MKATGRHGCAVGGEAVVHRPDRRLGAVVDVDLAQQRLEVNLDGRFRDAEFVSRSSCCWRRSPAPGGFPARAGTGRGLSSAGSARVMSSSMAARLVGNTFSPSMTSWSDWISASGDTLLHQEAVSPTAHSGAQRLDRQVVGQHHDPGGRESLPEGAQISFVRHRLAADHQVRRFGSLCGGPGAKSTVLNSAPTSKRVPFSRCFSPWRKRRLGSIRMVRDEVMAGSLRKRW